MRFPCFPLLNFSSGNSYTLPVVPTTPTNSDNDVTIMKSTVNGENLNEIAPEPKTNGATANGKSDNTSDEEAPKGRRLGVPAQKKNFGEKADDIKTVKYEKDSRSERLIRDAIRANEFLSSLVDEERLKLVVEVMYPKEFEANSYIIQEGQTGSHLYVSAEGMFEVIKGGAIVKKFSVGEAFGELAILYNAKRFASVKVTTAAKVWVLDQIMFQKIMMRTGLQEQEDNINFLRSVPDFQKLHGSVLAKISDLLKKEFFATGTVIVKQGDTGDKFYIIRVGSVTISKHSDENSEEKQMGTLYRGNFFGELALLHEDRRQATITAQAPGVECLTLDRVAFTEYLGNLNEVTSKVYDPLPVAPSDKAHSHIQLRDLVRIGTLGVGGFGRVELVQYRKNKEQTFALKMLKKIDMVQLQQQEHARNEKDIMFSCDSPFICKLYQTYKDRKYLYFLMEACLGGDLWTILQKRRQFDEKSARFMAACVVEAFEYLHARGIVYRDLKPENLMLNDKGYIKLVDFGFAKKINGKTWTFAGTPEYVAPEIILNRGHDRAVDYWALGVFIHELLLGRPPFRGSDHMKTYNQILRGIDNAISPKVPRIAQSIIRKLCRPIATERLGCQKDGIKDIKNHKWFLGFDWVALQKGKLPAPLLRPVRGPTDLSNFDTYHEDDDPPPDETSGWDRDF